MRQVALKGLMARKVRLALTALSIALGVTLMAGTYVFTDTINGSFKQIFNTSFQNVDVAVTPNTDLAGDNNPPPVPGAVLAKVKQVDGVAAAEGSVFSAGLVARRADGGKLKGVGFNAVTSVSQGPFGSATFTDGSAPSKDDQVGILKATAETEGLKVGDTLLISAQAPRQRYTISGIYKFGGVDSFGGGLIAAFTLPEAQRLAGLGDDFNEIDVAAKEGVSAAELRTRVAAALRGYRGLEVRTGTQEAKQQLSQINDSFLGVFRTALLAFAGIALFVGAFLIFNTFSITVAQRTREFALLRVLGAKRAQIMRSVLAEGLILGVLGSLIGLGLGVVTADGLRAMFKAFGADLPSTETVVATRTIVVSLVVGISITMLSSVAPAIRATRVPPLAALREGFDRERGPSRWSLIFGLVALAAGVAAMVVGLFAGFKAGAALSWLGLGAALTFLGVAFLSPRLVGPLASFVGAPLSRLGVAGLLARQNSVRQPGRTAVTAAALMIGVALVTFASIFASGAGKTIRDAVRGSFTGQAIIQTDAGGGPPSPISPKAVDAIEGVTGVRSVAATRFGQAKVLGEKTAVTGIDPKTFNNVYKVDWKQGDAQTLAGLTDGQILVSKSYAEDHGLKVGETLSLKTQREPRLRLTIAGITDDKGGLVGDLTVSRDALDRKFGVSEDAFIMAAFFPPESQAPAIRNDIQQTLDSAFPGLQVQSSEEFVKDQEKQVTQLLLLIYALLALAIIVSLFGIVNTLVLSISERTHEIGLLRAIGMSRRQVRRVIRYEAVITALIGAVLGMVLGIVLSVLVTRAIDDFALSIPIGSLVFLLVASAVAGVLAAILPARRAAKLDVLESLSYE